MTPPDLPMAPPAALPGAPDSLPGVLIIDDDPDLLGILAALLRPVARVRTAETGRAGLEDAEREEPEVVLLDLMLPEIDGREILRRLRAHHPATAVVIITGQGNETVAAACMKEGAADYIVKPFENRRVLSAVAQVATARARRLEIQRADERLRREHARLAEEKTALELQTRALEARVHERTRDLEEKNRTLSTLNETLLQQNRALADLKRSYEELFENAADGLVKTDGAGRILLANRQAQILCGSPLVDLRRRNIADFIPAEQRAAFLPGLIAVASRREETFRMETELRPPFAPPVLVEFRIAPLLIAGEEQYLEIHVENITQRRLDEERVRKLEERAIVAGMSRHLSHVLRNSLTSAGGFLAALGRETGLSTRGQDAVRIVLEEVRRMENVVRGYQDYVETTKARPAERCDLNALVAGAVAALPSPPAARLVLTAVAVEDRPAPVLLSRSIFLLGLNYLFSGISHAQAGGLPVAAELHAGVAGLEHRLRIFSPGVHLAADFLQILDRPWRHQILHQTFDSWDLAIAQTMFERHGGQLTVADLPEGTEYIGRLPLLAP